MTPHDPTEERLLRIHWHGACALSRQAGLYRSRRLLPLASGGFASDSVMRMRTGATGTSTHCYSGGARVEGEGETTAGRI